MQFYVDLLGLDLRGDRNAPIPFYTVDAINEFVDGPIGAEFRAAYMPIPGTSTASDPAEQIYLEAFEYRHIDRNLTIPDLMDIGVSNLRFIVRDLDVVLANAAASDVAVITSGGQSVSVPVPAGFTGTARSIMVRDPDGYPVELMEISPTPPSLAPASETILGTHMSLVVENIDNSLALFQRFINPDLQIWEVTPWQNTDSLETLRNIPSAQFRATVMLLPGTTIQLELLEFRGVAQNRYRPKFQDIGFGHIAFMTQDIEAVYAAMNELGMRSVSQTGTWTQINPSVRAIYTRDHNDFFLEVIESR
jgi:catechol 2,3-dioxygenase-like lactoylglutathione lyase family enzyme